MDELKAVKVVGSGAMGTVLLVNRKGSDDVPFALKAMSKSVIAAKPDGLRRARLEKDILARLKHPFLPSLLGHLDTDKTIALLLDYCPGGDLNALRLRQSEQTFSENVIRFYAAEIVLALEYLHSLGIVYRDLKPENILIQADGHIMLTDFDLSALLHTAGADIPAADGPTGGLKWFRQALGHMPPHGGRSARRVSPVRKELQRVNTFVGTEEYVSPEMVSGRGHNFGVDWWALGVLLYEMLYGKTPFKGPTRRETFFNILVNEPRFFGLPTPLADLIRRLLDKSPERRACADDVKAHEFFRGVDWSCVRHVSRPPFVPPPAPSSDTHGIEGHRIEEYVESFQTTFAAKIAEKRKCAAAAAAADVDVNDRVAMQRQLWVSRLPGAETGTYGFC